MKKGFKLLLIVLLALIIYYAIKLFTYDPERQHPVILLENVDEFNNLNVKNITKFKTDSIPTRIDIKIDGQINGEGLISIGYNDSISIYEHKLDSGKVEFEYNSGWQTKDCYVSFTPINSPTGYLLIDCFWN